MSRLTLLLRENFRKRSIRQTVVRQMEVFRLIFRTLNRTSFRFPVGTPPVSAATIFSKAWILSGLFFERRSSGTGCSHTVFRNVFEVLQKFFFSFGDGRASESGDVSDEGDAVVSDGESDETGNVALVAFVETFKQRATSGDVVLEIVADGLTTTHKSSLKREAEKGRIAI